MFYTVILKTIIFYVFICVTVFHFVYRSSEIFVVTRDSSERYKSLMQYNSVLVIRSFEIVTLECM